MLKKLCSKCGKIIPYGNYRCNECEAKCNDKKINNRYYNKFMRNKTTQTFYDSTEWKKTRKVVLSRDLGVCVVCKSKGVISYADIVHHIVELKEDNTKSLDTNNLISLCISCHNRIHSQYKANKTNIQTRLYKMIKKV